MCSLDRTSILPHLDNFWYGTTITSEHNVMYRLPLGINTFLSIEPLLKRLNVGLGSFGGTPFIIIGAETGNRKGKVVPEKEWVETICQAADLTQMSVFMKDSLIPIVGKENMRKELPWEKKKLEEYDGT